MATQVSTNRSDLRELMTIGQAAEMLNVHPNTLRRWNAQRLLTAYRVGPRGDRRFLRKDIIHLLNGDGR